MDGVAVLDDAKTSEFKMGTNFDCRNHFNINYIDVKQKNVHSIRCCIAVARWRHRSVEMCGWMVDASVRASPKHDWA